MKIITLMAVTTHTVDPHNMDNGLISSLSYIILVNVCSAVILLCVKSDMLLYRKGVM